MPLLIAISLARHEDARRCAAAGFAAHIGKPILLAELAKVVEQVRGAAAEPLRP